jgi:hypothetical protein
MQPAHLVDELLGDGPRKRNRPDALGGLGGSDDDFPTHVGSSSADAQQAAKWVEIAELKSSEFADAETTEGANEHESPISGVDRISQAQDFLDRESDWFASLDLREFDLPGGGEGDQSIPDRQSEDSGRDLPGFLDRGWSFALHPHGCDPRFEV